MDFVTNKALMIAVGVFVTIIITSSLFVILGYVLNIYTVVSKIDYASLMQIGEYDRYRVTNYDVNTGRFDTSDKSTITGVEVYNMINKYKYDSSVVYNYNDRNYNSETEKINLINSFKGGNLYKDDLLKKEYYSAVIENYNGNNVITKFIIKAK